MPVSGLPGGLRIGGAGLLGDPRQGGVTVQRQIGIRPGLPTPQQDSGSGCGHQGDSAATCDDHPLIHSALLCWLRRRRGGKLLGLLQVLPGEAVRRLRFENGGQRRDGRGAVAVEVGTDTRAVLLRVSLTTFSTPAPDISSWMRSHGRRS